MYHIVIQTLPLNREGKKKNTFCFHLFQVTKDMNGYGAYRRIEDKQINWHKWSTMNYLFNNLIWYKLSTIEVYYDHKFNHNGSYYLE